MTSINDHQYTALKAKYGGTDSLNDYLSHYWTDQGLAPFPANDALCTFYGGSRLNDLAYSFWRTYPHRLSLPGAAGSYASTPDHADLDIVGDLDLRVKAALTDWTPTAANALIGKWGAAGNRSYRFQVNTDGTLGFQFTVAGTTAVPKNSTVATGITDGAAKWVRVTMDVDNGALGYDVTFYLSDNGMDWTQLGDVVTTLVATSIHSGTAVLELGSIVTGTALLLNGYIYSAEVLSGIDGTVVASPDLTDLYPGKTSFTDEQGKVWTVHGSAAIV